MLALPALPVVRPATGSARGPTPGARADGRPLHQLRALKVRTGVVASASGSAMLELAHTKVMCSVFGPHAAEGRDYQGQGQLDCSLRFATFARRTRAPKAGPAGTAEERALSLDLAAALSASVQLQLLPKSTVAVHVLVLQDDGGALPAAVSCASLALADASIALFGLVAACDCAPTADGGVALDCSAAELASAGGCTVVASMPSLDQLTLLRHEGAVPFEQLSEALQLALSGCARLHEEMANALRSKAADAVETGDEDDVVQASRKRARAAGAAPA